MEFLAGSVNKEHGIFKSHCCGDELVLYKGITFPNCKKHQELATRWEMVGIIAMGPAKEEPRNKQGSSSGNPAA
jgi:hypothetical protein